MRGGPLPISVLTLCHSIYSVKFNGNCLTLENGSSANGAKIKCATQNKVKKGQIWVVKKQN